MKRRYALDLSDRYPTLVLVLFRDGTHELTTEDLWRWDGFGHRDAASADPTIRGIVASDPDGAGYAWYPRVDHCPARPMSCSDPKGLLMRQEVATFRAAQKTTVESL